MAAVAPTTPPPAPKLVLSSGGQLCRAPRETGSQRLQGWISLSCWQNTQGQVQQAVGLERARVLPTSCRLGPVEAPGARRQEALRSPTTARPARHETPSQRIALTTSPAALGTVPSCCLGICTSPPRGAGPREARHGNWGVHGRGRLLGLEPGQSAGRRPDAGKGTRWGSPRPSAISSRSVAHKAFPDRPEH